MSAVAAIEVTEQARALAGLLKEYAAKLTALNTDRVATLAHNQIPNEPSRAAWWLDQCEVLKQPLLRIVERASALHENAQLDPVLEDELGLRLTEIEIQLHHLLRQAGELRHRIDGARVTPEVARLRMAAGLSGMKGGPLRPNG